jgi:drug/metabolite transporter (DMT)-like permease
MSDRGEPNSYLMLRAFAPALFVFFWSTGFIVARGIVSHADAQLFLVCRFTSVALILGLAAAASRTRWPSPRQAVWHLLTGAVMMGLYLALSYWSIGHGLPAGIMALMGALQPLFTLLLMLSSGRERPTLSMALGLFIGFLGVLLVLLPRFENHALSVVDSASAAVGLVSIVALTLGTLAQRRLANDDLRTSGCLQNCGAAVIATMALCGFGTLRWDGSTVLWGTLVWAVLISSIVAQSLLMWMLRHGEATRVTALMLMVPPVAAIFAYALFHEILTPLQFVGFALALAGVALARRIA